MLSLRYDPVFALRLSKFFLRHPRIASKILLSQQAMYDALDSFLVTKYKTSSSTIRETFGFKVFLNPEDEGVSPRISYHGWYEGGTTRLFERLLKPGMRFVDVGANIGWFSLLAARLIGNNGVVYAFEPEVSCVNLLKKSVQANHFENLRIEQLCVSNSVGSVVLHVAVASHGGNSTTRPSKSQSYQFSRPQACTSLDVYFEESRRSISLLKVDVEGAEPEVLEGAQRLISSQLVDRIIMEWNPDSWNDKKDLLNSLFQEYRVYAVANTIPFPLLKPISKEQTDSGAEGVLYLKAR